MEKNEQYIFSIIFYLGLGVSPWEVPPLMMQSHAPHAFVIMLINRMRSEVIFGVSRQIRKSIRTKLIFQKDLLVISVCLHRLFEHDEDAVCAAPSAETSFLEAEKCVENLSK